MRRQLTNFDVMAYDPVWAPAGNDELYVINVDGTGLTQLTANDWEWDKYPSWSPDGQQIVLLITSSGPGEGKTFVAANLAVSLAQEGKRVILVDCDLRRPQIHKVFGIQAEPGFTNWASDPKLTLAQMLKPSIVPNLQILTCGTIPPNPSELLGSARAAELFQLLGDQADIVLYDTPPAATVTDAVILASQMDGVLQVVRAGDTRIDLVQRCKVLLERTNVHILGPILNGVQVSDLGYYANYYYYSGYYQGDTGNQKVGGKRKWWSRRRRKQVRQPQPQAANAQWTLLGEDGAMVDTTGTKVIPPLPGAKPSMNGLHEEERNAAL